jgi:hypothetical protein
MACHCTGCQRMTASAFSLSAGFPSEGFTVTKGEPVIGGLHGATRHYFCPHCMSWMFTRAEGFDWFVNLRATMLDDPSWFTPFGKRFVSCCGSRESGEALAAWWADSTSHLVWSGCAPCNDRALVRKAKAFGPTRADRAAEQADYRTWTADATAKLERDLILPWDFTTAD